MQSHASPSFWRRHPIRTALLLVVGVPAAIGAIVPLAFALSVVLVFAAPVLLLPAVAVLVAGGLSSQQPGWHRGERESVLPLLADPAQSAA